MSDAPTSTNDKSLYEGLFLFSPAAGTEIDETLQLVRDMIERVEGEIVTLAKWEERKLAYTIGDIKRGLYVLSLFRVDGTKIVNIERDCNLSEDVVRAMITKADHMGELEIEAAINGAQTATEIEEFKNGGTPGTPGESTDAAPAEAAAEAPAADTEQPAAANA
ncbi:MAG: 30S ribosomal protein S6 [Planctomycetota bacterium]